MTTRIEFNDGTYIELSGKPNHPIWHRGPNVPCTVEDSGNMAVINGPYKKFLMGEVNSVNGEEVNMPLVKTISFTPTLEKPVT